MRAYVLTKYGGPQTAESRDIPIPQPRPGEVRIRVRAAGLNPVDYKLREGQLKVITRYPLPVVLGNELAGTVDALGEGVTRFQAGDEVFARVVKEDLGAFAEYACVREDVVARKPRTLDFTQAAAVPLAGLTALQALRDELKVSRGQRVFIPGGAGGVGTFALQLARHFGAQVATTASARGRELVTRLGADIVVDYTSSDFTRELKDQDSALDLVGGDTLTRAFDVVKRGGRVVSIAGMPEPKTATLDLGRGPGLAALFWVASAGIRLRAARRGVSYRYLFMHPSGADLEELAKLIDARALEVVVDRVFPFEDIAGAFAYLEQGRAKGKVVVQMG
ncbi:NADP-dependent oxidoreductase [Corallococcus carmarthensis]|uniref:NADP-dependent oxidoreductase n=1 Tax=Corallococcus carmarthensis TaxID=2316728 RepID=A0A3A8JHL6_9BACT|nr:NADP-dependent oxidoreductase [Corallococcus carmarthensis]NOK22019.1 NADP-dependent oxidoreductase [Corallococcus carmarthensis]RKG95227.1 NADP-dependent oxidoreductase [Corallococcus carmarthensis]